MENDGWSVSFANDFDPDKEEMYSAHFGKEEYHFIKEDIRYLGPNSIQSSTLATASFPCNDLSLAGSRNGLNSGHSSTFWEFIRIINGMRHRKPPLVLIENVPGFITSHRGKDFKAALLELKQTRLSG